MSSSKSSSSTRRKCRPLDKSFDQSQHIFRHPDKISRSRCSSAEIRSCRAIFRFLATKSPLSMDPRVVHVRPASKKKGSATRSSDASTRSQDGGLCRPATARLNRPQQSDSKQSHDCVWPHGIAGTTTASCLGCMRCSNPANCFRPAAEYGRRQVPTSMRPLPQAFFAKSMCTLNHILPYSFPFSCAIHLRKSGHSISLSHNKTAQCSAGRLLQITKNSFAPGPPPSLLVRSPSGSWPATMSPKPKAAPKDGSLSIQYKPFPLKVVAEKCAVFPIHYSIPSYSPPLHTQTRLYTYKNVARSTFSTSAMSSGDISNLFRPSIRAASSAGGSQPPGPGRISPRQPGGIPLC